MTLESHKNGAEKKWWISSKRFLNEGWGNQHAFKIIDEKQGYGIFNQQLLSEAHFLYTIQHIDTLLTNGIPLKQDKKTSVIHLQGMKLDLVVKQYHLSHILQPLKYRFKMPRALRFWQYSQLLINTGVSVIPVLGIWQQKNSLGPLQGFVLMPFQSGLTLKTFVAMHQEDLPRLSNVIKQVVAIYTKMKALRLSHGDFKASNFLVDEQDKVYLLDLDAVKYHASDSACLRAQARDKARLLKNFRKMPAVLTLFEEVLAKHCT